MSDGRLDGMRRALNAARGVESQAVEQTSLLLAAGNASEARNAAAAGGIWSDKSLALEREIVKTETDVQAQATRLQRDQLQLQAAVLRATFVAIDIPMPVASMRELAARAAAGEPLEVPEEVAAADRERARAAIRGEHLDELIAEGWALADEDEGTERGEHDGPDQDLDAIEGEEDDEREPLEHEGLEAPRHRTPAPRQRSRFLNANEHPSLREGR
jgi:hypothetical protein